MSAASLPGRRMPDEKPLSELIVGDRFWLAYAQDIVRGAITAPERRAEQLAAAIAWFWTIYSAAALVALTTGAARLPSAAPWLLALPSAILILAYWLAARVRRPMPIDFDQRIPEQIAQVHAAVALQKRASLRNAEAAAGVAAACVVVALLAAMLGTATPRAELSALVDPLDRQRLTVLAQVSKNALVVFSAQPASAPASAVGPAASAIASSLLKRADADGVVQATFATAGPLPQRVSAAWTDDKVERTASVVVGREP